MRVCPYGQTTCDVSSGEQRVSVFRAPARTPPLALVTVPSMLRPLPPTPPLLLPTQSLLGPIHACCCICCRAYTYPMSALQPLAVYRKLLRSVAAGALNVFDVFERMGGIANLSQAPASCPSGIPACSAFCTSLRSVQERYGDALGGAARDTVKV